MRIRSDSARNWLQHLIEWLLATLLGVIITGACVFVWVLEQRPDLDVWHTVILDEEFTTDSTVTDLAQYVALEDRLFTQLDREIYGQTGPADASMINRYRRGSLADPGRWQRNWNRTFILEHDEPTAAVLLLHGLSDSPYSLRHLGQSLHAAGAHVVGLRIPGHGTIPSGLVAIEWQDMAEATALALRDLKAKFPDSPIYIVGYSNGAALALNATLDALLGAQVPRPDRLVLLSPEIQVTPFAALAIWQARFGHWLGLEKLAWNDIQLEYDPFKYGSFSVNAGDVSYRLTVSVQEKLQRLKEKGALERMPPILAFSSVVDATVQAPALVSRLFNPLPPGEHELVLFDINRRAAMDKHLIRWQPDEMLTSIQQASDREYVLTLISNLRSGSQEVESLNIGPDEFIEAGKPLGLLWPDDVFSLSHIALGFPVTDSLYGAKPVPPSPGIQLGTLALRGERGILRISEAAMLRQRWNPFYDYLRARTLTFLELDP